MTQDLLETPVLFLVFNRPDTTARVFEEIRRARPARLYVAADGPRPDRPGEKEKTEEVRRIATAVDWPCEVRTLFREENLGCGKGPESGIYWFFSKEIEGIILEDDCLPNQTFFCFCNDLLVKFRGTPEIMTICGSNHSPSQKKTLTYSFGRYSNCWGWASWRRAWIKYDRSLSFLETWLGGKEFKQVLPSRAERKYWSVVFTRMKNCGDDVWDYQWMASVLHHKGINIVPSKNLVENIGQTKDATHTTEIIIDQKRSENIYPFISLEHPDDITIERAVDRDLFYNRFGGRYTLFPWFLLNLPERIFKFLKKKFYNVR